MAASLGAQVSYANQSFGQRFSKMGDESEDIFEEEAPLGTFSRYGWNRNADFRRMSRFVAATPDYYCSVGILVEVMGMSGDWFNAMKLDKWESMKQWNALNEVAFFIWNTKRKTWVLVSWEAMKRLVAAARRAKRIGTWESDGNQFYKIPWADLLEAASDSGTR